MTDTLKVLVSPDGSSELHYWIDKDEIVTAVELHDDDGIHIVTYEEAMSVIRERGNKNGIRL